MDSNFKFSVTGRAAVVEQPEDGFLPLKLFEVRQLYDGEVLNPEENIFACFIGTIVDDLARFLLSGDAAKAFHFSLIGAGVIGKEEFARKLLCRIKGLDDDSIIAANRLVRFDVCYRAGAEKYRECNIEPDRKTMENIRIMVRRAMRFFQDYGPIIDEGFSFEGGYSSVVVSGDGDFLSSDTLWDFKVSKYGPNTKQTLQILIYFILGCHAGREDFKNLKFLGIFNPRLNRVYRVRISDIPESVISQVEREVICYPERKEAGPHRHIYEEVLLKTRFTDMGMFSYEVCGICKICGERDERNSLRNRMRERKIYRLSFDRRGFYLEPRSEEEILRKFGKLKLVEWEERMM